MSHRVPLATLALFALSACAAEVEGQGRLRVLLEAEETITQGLAPGEGEEDVRDGWSVQFDRYLVAIGGVRLRHATDVSRLRSAPASFVVDLTRVPESGSELWQLDSLEAGRWSFSYSIGVSKQTRRHSTVDASAFRDLVASKSSYRLVGSITKPDGVSCPPAGLSQVERVESVGSNAGGVRCYANPEVRFDLSLGVPVEVGPCERDGSEGVAIGDGTTTTAAVTIHGDHVFFNGFPESAEGGVVRLAQWFADSDLDVDGRVTREELAEIAVSDLWELDLERYQFGGSPLTPLASMLTYLEAQLATQGHFQGEGECAFAPALE